MRKLLARRHFREMDLLEDLIAENRDLLRVQVIDEVSLEDRKFPLYVLSVGSENLEDPVIGYFGGVHGLEKIGTEVVLSQLSTVLNLMRWDESFKQRLKRTRLLFMPIVNPVGIVLRTRSNGRGVDLMRNSPLDGTEIGGPIYRGHRIGPMLPWFRGWEGEMEIESKALCKVVEEQLFPSKLAMAIDVHSGFGAKDRLWFPFAYSEKPFPFLAEAHAFKSIYDQTYSHHFYEIEPVCRQYTINGDLWDYLFLKKYESSANSKGVFIPWTLEMGSWMWVKKNPLQVFTKFGVFHPIKPHRYNRILRRHINLFDFFHRSILSAQSWSELSPASYKEHLNKAKRLWYKDCLDSENENENEKAGDVKNEGA